MIVKNRPMGTLTIALCILETSFTFNCPNITTVNANQIRYDHLLVIL